MVYYCAKKCKLDWKTAPYVLLGDDIVIAHRDLALKYMEIIDALGVDISQQKTHVSVDTYEFAKRWIHKGEEISPFPLGGWKEVCSKYHLMVNFLQSLLNKG